MGAATSVMNLGGVILTTNTQGAYTWNGLVNLTGSPTIFTPVLANTVNSFTIVGVVSDANGTEWINKAGANRGGDTGSGWLQFASANTYGSNLPADANAVNEGVSTAALVINQGVVRATTAVARFSGGGIDINPGTQIVLQDSSNLSGGSAIARFKSTSTALSGIGFNYVPAGGQVEMASLIPASVNATANGNGGLLMIGATWTQPLNLGDLRGWLLVAGLQHYRPSYL